MYINYTNDCFQKPKLVEETTVLIIYKVRLNKFKIITLIYPYLIK